MIKLDKLYRKAPLLESPATLDDHVLSAARSRVPEAAVKTELDKTSQVKTNQGKTISRAQKNPKWWGVGYAISYLCIFGIGLGVLLQAGFFPIGGQVSPTVSETATTRNVATPASDKSSAAAIAERSGVAKEDSSIQASRTSLDTASSSESMAPVSESPLSGPPESSPPVSLSTAVATDANTQVTSAMESMTATDTTAAIAESEVASHSVTEFSKSQQSALTANVITDGADTAPEPASVASIESAIAGVASADVGVTADAEAGVTESASAKIQTPVQRQRAAPESAVSESRELSDTESAMTVRSVEWLLSQASDQYTIMVAADNTAENLILLGNELSITTELVQISNGEYGWLLLHGSFSQSRNAELVLPGLFAAAYSANAAVDAVDSFIKLKVIPYSTLHDLLE